MISPPAVARSFDVDVVTCGEGRDAAFSTGDNIHIKPLAKRRRH